MQNRVSRNPNLTARILAADAAAREAVLAALRTGQYDRAKQLFADRQAAVRQVLGV
jgi:hypothetical protein